MITWMVNKSIFDSLESLDLPELVLAKRKGFALLESLLGKNDDEFGAPIVAMWQGFEPALAAYVAATSAVLIQKFEISGDAEGANNGSGALGVSSLMKEARRHEGLPFEAPSWFEDVDILRSHRSNLMRRFPSRYNFPQNQKDMPYLWPFVQEDGSYIIRISKHDREMLKSGERSLSKSILERIS